MRIVVYDDERELGELLQKVVGEEGKVRWVQSRDRLWEVLEDTPDLVVLDVYFEPDRRREGIEALREMAQRFPFQPFAVWVISRYLSERDLYDIGEVELQGWKVEKIERAWRGEDGIEMLRERLEQFRREWEWEDREGFDEMIRWYEAQEIKTQFGNVRFVAASKAIRRILYALEKHQGGPVVLLGESGTGKTLIAELWARRRKEKMNGNEEAFRVQNCAYVANPGDSVAGAAEIFGTAEKGPVAGSSKGLVEPTNFPWGVLVLDEFQALGRDTQELLLHLVDTHPRFRRVFEDKDHEYQGTVVLCSTWSLDQLREELIQPLWYRIAWFVYELPPLRNRKEDVAAFLKVNLPDVRFSDQAWHYLVDAFSWPFNMRHLVYVVDGIRMRGYRYVDLPRAREVLGESREFATLGAGSAGGETRDPTFWEIFTRLEQKARAHRLSLRDVEMLWVGYLLERYGGVPKILETWGVSQGYTQPTLYRRREEWTRATSLHPLLRNHCESPAREYERGRNRPS